MTSEFCSRVVEPHAASELVSERFELVRELKVGQGIATHLARDVTTDSWVVLKIAHREEYFSSFARMRLEHEAQLLAGIDDARLARLVAVGSDGGRVFLAMAHVAGETLEQVLKSGALPPRDALDVVLSLSEVLHLVHVHGVVHRDIKPSNVILKKNAKGAYDVTLVDFGLARSSSVASSLDELPVGTAYYVAPEQAGTLEGGVDERSDLYSLGIVLYEALVGRPPFAGARVSEVLRCHLTHELPELAPFHDLGGNWTLVITELLRRMTAKDPRDRYQTAAAVRDDLAMLMQALRSDKVLSIDALGRHDKRTTLTEPSFVGRQREVGVILEKMDDARAGRPSFLVVEGGSGAGKSRLLEEVKRRARQNGFWVLCGFGLNQAARRPFQILAGVVSDTIMAIRSDPIMAQRLKDQLEDRWEALVAALPELGSVGSAHAATALAPEEFGELRTIEAVRCFLDALGKLGRPVLIILDDAQWADELSIRLLRTWWTWHDKHQDLCSVVMLISYRSEEVAPNHPLRQTVPTDQIMLDPLNRAELQKLAESMAGPLPKEVVDAMARSSEGNPFMAAALLRGFAECGMLRSLDDGWHFEPKAPLQIHPSLKAATVLVRRMEMLSESTLHLLSIAAVLGKEFDLVLATRMAGQTMALAMSAIAEARQRHIVWKISEGGRVAFVHDKLREALLTRMVPRERVRLHALAARSIAESEPERIFDLAFHFDASGESERAAPYAMKAAQQARKQHALVVAVQNYLIAERGVPTAFRETRLDLHEGLGEVLMLQGRYDEAQLQFELACPLADDAARRAALKAALGELAFKRGNMREARDVLESALTLLGEKVSTHHPKTLIWQALREVLIQCGHGLLRRRERALRTPMPPKAQLASRIYSRLTYTYWFVSGRMACLWAHLRHLNLVERFAPGPEMAQAYSDHSPVMTMIPWFSRGLRYVEASLELRRRQHNLWAEGQSSNFLGVSLYCASRFKESIDAFSRATHLLERMGDRWEANVASWHIALCHYRLGHLREAIKEARATYDKAMEIGDFSAAGMAIGIWSRASGGHVPAEVIEAQLDRARGDAFTRVELLMAEARRRMSLGLWKEATDPLGEAWRICKSRGLRQEYSAAVAPWMATALRRSIEAHGALARCSRQSLRELETWTKRALRLARFYRNNLPHALREAGFLAAFLGKKERALTLLLRSEAEAKRQGARAEELESRIVRCRLREGGGQDVRDERTSAELELRSLSDRPKVSTPTLSVLDRFDGLLGSGRAIIAARDIAEIENNVCEAARRLLRCERACFIQLDSNENGDVSVPATVSSKISRALLEKTLASAQVSTHYEDAAHAPSDSLLLSDIRSAMCVPISSHGRLTACLYVAHERVGYLYKREDERLGSFLGALAGIAIENSESFTRLSQMNAALEIEAAEQRQLADALRMAKDAADSANRAKSEFLANISHELRTPLTAILGYARLLVDCQLVLGDGREYLEVMVRNGDHLLSLVNSILDLERVESGKIEINRSAVDLLGEIKAVVQTLQVSARERGLSMKVKAAPDAVHVVQTDPLRIKQILTNVVGNAVKFTDDGEISISLERAALAFCGEAKLVAIRVRDTGVGIAQKDLPRLFKPFQQLDGSSTRRYGGTGLGLALSRDLARALGGDLILEESTLGAGSTFTILLPGDDDACGIPAKDHPHERNRRDDSRCLSGIQVLVAEDCADNRDLVEQILHRQGAAVTLVKDGAEAVEAAQSAVFDVVLMDLQMPIVDGYKAVQVLRNAGYAKCIVALTAHSMKYERERCLASGFDYFVTKPLEPRVLSNIVAQCANRLAPLPSLH